jgi:hypothetical protein
MHGESHHGGTDPVDDVDDGPRIGIEQRLVIGRDWRNIGSGHALRVSKRIGQRHYCHVYQRLRPALGRHLVNEDWARI